MVGANGSALPNYEHKQHPVLNDDHLRNPDHESGRTHQSDNAISKLNHANEQSQEAVHSNSRPQRRGRSVSPFRGPKPLLPRSLKEALQLASLLSKSKLVPKGFENPEACLVGILYGMEVGLSPIAALQRMAIIDGRPTIWGDAALALVEASGLLIKIEERIEISESKTDHQSSVWPHNEQLPQTVHQRPDQADDGPSTKSRTAICQVLRSGRSEPITRTFSIEDAKRAGLWQKPGPWTDYPDRMLMMRARAFALRDAFPDVLMGLYLKEEFEGLNNQASSNHEDKMNSDWNKDADNRSRLQSDWDAHAPNQAEQINPAKSYPPRGDNQGGNQSLRPSPMRRAPPPPPVEIEVEVEAPSRPKNQLTTPIEGLENNLDLPVLSESDKAAPYQSASDTLELFDSALACANDEETLEEIREEFIERIDRLDSASLQEAGRIFLRHEKRIEATEVAFKTSSESPYTPLAQDPSIGSSEADKIEDGLGEVDDETEECESGLIENNTGRIGKDTLSPHRNRRHFSTNPRKGLSLAELNARRKVDLMRYLPRSFTKKEDSDED
jgi:hypothetical protein